MTSSLRAAIAGGVGAALAGMVSCSAHSEPLSQAVFAKYLTSCSQQYPVILQAPVSRPIAHALVEGGGKLDPFAIHDNSTRKGASFQTVAEAVSVARQLLAEGHRIDAGVMQVTNTNWSAYGLTIETVFDPHANICAGARILGEAWAMERRTACRYNTGKPECSNGYPELVQKAEARLAQSPAAVVVEPPIPERKPEVFDVLHGTFVQTGGAAGPVNLLDHRRIRHEADVHSEQGNNS